MFAYISLMLIFAIYFAALFATLFLNYVARI